MARIAPGNTPKFGYFVLIILASLFLYLDIQYKTFTSTKNFFNAGLIATNLVIKNIVFTPISNLYKLTNNKLALINSNELLVNELELSKSENFLILNKDKLFNDNSELYAFINDIPNDYPYEIATISSFDTNLYKCCDNHRLHLFNNSSPFKKGGTVINSTGIIGQISDSNNKVSEVILISDINHSIPIKSNTFFCNANGSGKPQVLECKYDPSLWKESFEIGRIFYSSGLGGIFPEGIMVGSIISIENAAEGDILLNIESIANPLTQKNVIVLYPNDIK